MEKIYSYYHWVGVKKSPVCQNKNKPGNNHLPDFTTGRHDLIPDIKPDYNANYLSLNFERQQETEDVEEQCGCKLSTQPRSLPATNEQSSLHSPTRGNTVPFYRLKLAIITKADITVIKHAVETSPVPMLWLEKDESEGNNALHLATRYEHLEAMRYFLALEDSVELANSKNHKGHTPLHCTLASTPKLFLESLRILAENGADLNAVMDEQGNTFAHLCASHLHEKEFPGSVNCLIKLGYGKLFCRKNELEQTPLHVAILRRMDIDLETLMLISHSSGYDFNERCGTEGDTFLHLAAKWGASRKKMESIIALGGDWHMLNNYHKTVLHCAVAGANVEVMKFFISLGADVNARDFLGRTPLHHLQFVKQQQGEKLVESTKLLVENGADVLAVDDAGNTVAHHLSGKMSKKNYDKWASYVKQLGLEKLFSLKNNVGSLARLTE